jgi:hypothetical protein
MSGHKNNNETVAGNAAGHEAVWFIYSGGQQIGPFTTEQAGQLVARKAVAADSYVFRVGWKDWRPVEECHEELGLPPVGKLNQAALEDRRKVAPRASVTGRVVIHNNGNLTIGAGVNVSTSGIFVETNEPIFTIGEKLKLSVKAEGMEKPFNAVAQVVRYNSDPRFPMGYGLKFEVLSDRARADIKRLVEAKNNGVAPKVARG